MLASRRSWLPGAGPTGISTLSYPELAGPVHELLLAVVAGHGQRGPPASGDAGVDRVLVAVRVAERVERARRGVVDAVGVLPQRLLLGEGQHVAVEVELRVGVERVRVGTLPGIRQHLVRIALVLVVVEVLRRLVLVAVLDRVPVGVELAGIRPDRLLGDVGQQVVVVVAVDAVLDAVVVAVALVRRARPASAGAERRSAGERLRLVNLLPSFLDSTRRRKRVGTGLPALTTNCFWTEAGTITRSIFLRAEVGLDEDRPSAVALEHDRVLLAAWDEVAPADRQGLTDRNVKRRDLGDYRRLLLFLGGLGGRGDRPRDGGGEKGDQRGCEGGAARQGADAGS